MSKKVLLLLPTGFEELEAAAFTDVMGWSRMHGIEPVDLITAGIQTEIKSAWGHVFQPQLLASQAQAADYDALALPGGFETAGYYNDAFDEIFLRLIRDFSHQGKPLASVCVGALPLARAGVLKDGLATTYDLPAAERTQQLAAMGAILKDSPIVVNDNIITSMGPATALDVAFTLLELLTGKRNVQEVRYWMRFPV